MTSFSARLVGLLAASAAALASGCQDTNLASTNIADIPDAGPLPLQAAVQKLFIYDNNPPQLDQIEAVLGPPGSSLGTISLLGGLPAASGCKPNHACWRPEIAKFNKENQKHDPTLPGLFANSPTDVGFIFFNTLNTQGVDLGLFPSPPGLPITAFAPPPATLHLNGDPQVERRRSLATVPGSTDVTVATDDVGLFVPLSIDFDQGSFEGTIDVDCLNGIASPPIPLAFQIVKGFCPTLVGLEVGGLPAACYALTIEFKINRLRLFAGLVPDPQKKATGGDWTKLFFPGSKDFHLSDMPDVRFVIAGTPTFEGWGSTDNFDIDQTDDIVVRADLSCTNPLASAQCDIVDCNNIIADQVVGTMAPQIQASVETFLNDPKQLASHLSFNGPAPGACGGLTLTTCALQNFPQILTDLNASATYQKWDWFAGPFGPYHPNALDPTQVGWLPVTSVVPDTGGDVSDGASGQITFTFDDDMDGDGIPTPSDPHPTCNDNTPDCDADGLPNDCDPCPCSTDNDSDGDGICGQDCIGDPNTACVTNPVVNDNCSSAYNPDQANCNHDIELQRVDPQVNGFFFLGDACDPVPCAAHEVQGAVPVEPNAVCQTVDNSLLSIRPLQSAPLDAAFGPAVQLPKVKTDARFCQPDPAQGIKCTDLDLQDKFLDDTACAPPVTGLIKFNCPTLETNKTRFHRITFSAANEGNGLNPNNSAASLNYNVDAEDNTPTTFWTWDFAKDVTRWLSFPEPLVNVSNGSPLGLLGTLWLHTESDVGSLTTPATTGKHGDGLANHYDFQFSPSRIVCHGVAGGGVGQNGPNFILRTLPDPPPDGFGLPDSERGQAEIVVETPSAIWGALDSLGQVRPVGGLLGPNLLTRLSDGSLIWANSVEPTLVGGAGPSFPLSIALSADGSQIIDTITTNGTSLLAEADRAITRIPSTGSPHVSNFFPVLTRTRAGIFVVGGTSNATGELAGDIWFTTLSTNHWTKIHTGFAPSKVLAATYSYASEKLYVLDEAPYCRSATLDASRTYKPSHWSDATATIESTMVVKLPAYIPVTVGNAGNKRALLTIKDSATNTKLVCTYRGGSKKAHPTTFGEEFDGRNYLFDHCRELTQSHACHDGDDDDDGDDGGGKGKKSLLAAGDAVGGDVFSLHVDKGDKEDGSKETAIELVLPEVAPCAGRVARLASVDFMTWNAGTIGTFLRHTEWSSQALVSDLDGSVLVASTNPAADKHSIFKIDVRAPGGPAAKGVEHGTSRLLLPPVVDGLGYTLVTGSNAAPKRIRKRQLDLIPASLEDLGKQL